MFTSIGGGAASAEFPPIWVANHPAAAVTNMVNAPMTAFFNPAMPDSVVSPTVLPL